MLQIVILFHNPDVYYVIRDIRKIKSRSEIDASTANSCFVHVMFALVA